MNPLTITFLLITAFLIIPIVCSVSKKERKQITTYIPIIVLGLGSLSFEVIAYAYRYGKDLTPYEENLGFINNVTHISGGWDQERETKIETDKGIFILYGHRGYSNGQELYDVSQVNSFGVRQHRYEIK